MTSSTVLQTYNDIALRLFEQKNKKLLKLGGKKVFCYSAKCKEMERESVFIAVRTHKKEQCNLMESQKSTR